MAHGVAGHVVLVAAVENQAAVPPSGTVAVTLQNFTSTASATLSENLTGTVAVTLESFTSNASGGPVITLGTAAVTLQNHTSTGTSGPPSIWYVKEVGAVTDTSAGTTSAITVAAGGVPIGDTLVLYGACDNTGASGVATTIAVADNSNNAGTANTWALQTPQAIADPGAASAGQQGFFVVCSVTRSIDAGDTITVTYGNSTTAKAINVQQFTGANTTTPVLASSYARQDNQTAQSVSVATTPTVAGQIVCTLVAVEGGTADAFTQDTDTTNGSWVALTRRGSGTTTSGSTLNSTYKIVTASGSQTYDHATMLGTSRDHCAAILVLDHAPVSGTSATTLQVFTGAATGTETVSGTSATTLQSFTSTASGLADIVGTSAPTLQHFTSTATGELTGSSTGTSAVTLADFIGAASGTETITGTSAVTLANFTSTASASTFTGVTGTVAVTLANFTAATRGVNGSFAKGISGRRLTDHAGKDYVLKCMSSWGLAQNLSNADITTVLEGLVALHFNTVNVMMFGYHLDGTWEPYENLAGDPVFTGTPYQSSLGSAWASMDWVVSEAYRLGITVAMSLYSAFGSSGPQADMEAASDAEMEDFGEAVATRYLDYENIIWHYGADTGVGANPDIIDRVEAFFTGVNNVEGSTRRVIRVFEPANDVSGYSEYSAWYGNLPVNLSVNSMYKYDAGGSVELTDAVHNESGATTIPWWDCEPPYVWAPHYGNVTTVAPQELRERLWTVFIRQGVGINWGNEDFWPFGKGQIYTGGRTWQQVLTDPDSYWAQWCWDMLTYVGNCAGWTRDSGGFITSGLDTGDTQAASSYSTAKGLVYIPTSRSITADLTEFSGSYTACRVTKVDVHSGTQTVVGQYSTSGSQVVGALGNNASGSFSDWVLLFEGVNDPTGTVAVTLQSFTSTATGLADVVGTSAVTLQAFTSTTTGVETFTATSATSLQDLTGAATGAIGAVGTSAVTLQSFTSNASGTETITGTTAVTLANFTSTATGTETFTATSATTLQNVTGAASGIVANPVSGTSATSLQDLTGAATGTETVSGTSATTLQSFTSTASASTFTGISGTSAVTLADFTGTASGTVDNPTLGTSAVTLANFTSAAAGTETITGTSATSLQNATSSATATVVITGTIAATLEAAVAVAAGIEAMSGTLARTLQSFTASATGTVVNDVTGFVAVTLQNFGADIDGQNSSIIYTEGPFTHVSSPVFLELPPESIVFWNEEIPIRV